MCSPVGSSRKYWMSNLFARYDLPCLERDNKSYICCGSSKLYSFRSFSLAYSPFRERKSGIPQDTPSQDVLLWASRDVSIPSTYLYQRHLVQQYSACFVINWLHLPGYYTVSVSPVFGDFEYYELRECVELWMTYVRSIICFKIDNSFSSPSSLIWMGYDARSTSC